MIVRILSGCCPQGFMGKSAAAKKQHPRGLYFGCMSCGKYVDRQEAAYQIRIMRRTVRELGLQLSERK